MKHIKSFTFFVFFTFCLAFSIESQGQNHPFHNRDLSADQRIDILLDMLTIEEKINLLSTDLGVPRLGIRSTGHSEGLHGMALGGPAHWGGRQDQPTTTFPQAYGLGSTWDTALVRKVAEIEAHEIRYYTQRPENPRGGMVMRAPNADLARDPRWGRTEESYGEDAYLASRLTVAFVKGLQGDHPEYWKSASLMKHFMANSNEDGRDSTSSDFDERLFREYYSYPFYKGITEGGSRAFMASYNAWNGIPMTIHPILESITRREWGNNGIICTDGGALRLLITAHKAFPTLWEGAAAVVKATVGQFLDDYLLAINQAVTNGILTEGEIDRAIRGNLYVALKLGLLDSPADYAQQPYTGIGVTDTRKPWEDQKVKDFARLVTAKSAVLLKNNPADGEKAPLLPLNADKIRSIAVIGPRANEVLYDWYSGTPAYAVTILEGIRNAVGPDVKVFFEPSNTMDKAVIAASKADVAVVCIGNHPYGTDARWFYSPVPSDGREAVDRKALTLEQEDLAKLVLQANPRTVLALVSSFPFAINWSDAHIPSIVHITNNSQEMGNGLADVLFGKVNPAGRTTQTWVRDITDLPPIMDYNIRNGRTYMYFKGEPLYPFGYGLSYTRFEYGSLKVEKAFRDSVNVEFILKNTGKLDGEEVVQLYVEYPASKVERPGRQLAGFARVMVPAGESVKVTLCLKAENLAYWDAEKDMFVTEEGPVNLLVGSSSADIKLKGSTRLI
ncbi:MAG: glycoside hydrolase family 3 C-terminal domain-containing protein [Bacteroidales bacterium]|mgnify:FL=1|jgi:beta-glucosidase|nr:glycoside hydrolase family 3 C-terminal domain-containing protein [Bacteroidales bacterium]MDD2770772.1 glycoside hydrolase family 3 C-terminal domain-containing protein [Bacteroidales bacterium]MDD3104501.1 glycoside hydrolase family 3 C-terminal domain-containing protein [Bacteroidales bacterium]MDD3549103.1 glycoside hydrolase family 3 C-terminal domain-containing protein [Bacteroidales bacterium]MDD4064134.1 glycoside hydrolase family 3 C-terminal domain-containing protein [Bacteroidales